MTKEVIYEAAIIKYGVEAQKQMVIEECAELIHAKCSMKEIKEYPEIMKKAAQGAIDNGFNWVARGTNNECEVELYSEKPEWHTDGYYCETPLDWFSTEVPSKYYPTLKEGECLNLHEIVNHNI